MKPALLAAALALLLLPACGPAPTASTRAAGRDAATSGDLLDPETLIDTISRGEQVSLEDYLPDDETIPTVVYFTADW